MVGIYEFATTVDLNCVRFLNDAIAMERHHRAGGPFEELRYACGPGASAGPLHGGDVPVRVCLCLYRSGGGRSHGGSTLPVMSTTGSGNQGHRASLPVVAARPEAGQRRGYHASRRDPQSADYDSYRRISASFRPVRLRYCGSIGSSAGIVYLLGGGINEILSAIQNMIADVTGLICDGAKSGCALKIASAPCQRGAMRAAGHGGRDCDAAGRHRGGGRGGQHSQSGQSGHRRDESNRPGYSGHDAC